MITISQAQEGVYLPLGGVKTGRSHLFTPETNRRFWGNLGHKGGI
jgi:hypothetical protein